MNPRTILHGLFMALLGGSLVAAGVALGGAFLALIVMGAPVGVLGGWLIGEGLGF